MKLLPFLIGILLTSSAYCQHYDFADVDFSKEDSIAINSQFKGNLDPVKIAQALTKDLTTDIQKFRVIFRWIAENIKYDVNLYSKKISHNYDPKRWPGRAARWSKKINRLYTRHTIRQRMTICEGYSWLLETMCRTAGLSCVVVPGYARSMDSGIGRRFKPNHAWNAIKINDKWYLSDPTWSSGGLNSVGTKYIKRFNDVYFLVSPDDLIADHYPSDPNWMLLLNKPSLNDFFNAPIKTTGFLENRVVHHRPEAGNISVNRDSLFTISFTMNRPLKSFAVEASTIRNKKFISETLPVVPYQDNEGYYSMAHTFKEKGEYYLYINVNRRLTLVYKISVK